jgi:hypothetical protein
VPHRSATDFLGRDVAFRAVAAGGVALALAVAFGGCVPTSLSAAEVRVPVLLGPVPCIGCGPAARLPAPAPLARVAGRRRAYAFVLPLPPLGFAITGDSQLGISADRLLVWTPCRDDLQLSEIDAQSWQVTVPLLFYIYDVFVEADATEVIAPGASCPPP